MSSSRPAPPGLGCSLAEERARVARVATMSAYNGSRARDEKLGPKKKRADRACGIGWHYDSARHDVSEAIMKRFAKCGSKKGGPSGRPAEGSGCG